MVEKTRYAAMPDVPIIGETVPGFEMSSWIGLFAPAGTPAPVANRLSQEIVRTVNLPDIKEKFLALGVETVGNSPQEAAASVKAGIATAARATRIVSVSIVLFLVTGQVPR
jgi:tripartite-type tricarboxylate transporter receptor subunit TctC